VAAATALAAPSTRPRSGAPEHVAGSRGHDVELALAARRRFARASGERGAQDAAHLRERKRGALRDAGHVDEAMDEPGMAA